MSHETTTNTSNEAPALALDSSISFADYATSTLTDPQPAWRTLNAARERAYTGEIKFKTTPAIRAYVDGGSVYYAERDGEPSLGQRLLDAGVMTPQQLDRGIVRVGTAEHLGRLFDRDESIDRDAVMVVVEENTAAIVAELAAGMVSSIVVSAYRHHQSGVHRWFVAPSDTSLTRPVSDVAQVDRSVIDDLPDVTSPLPEFRIEWEHITVPDNSDAVVESQLSADRSNVGEIDIEAELERFDADGADWSTPADPTSSNVSSDSWLGEFQIVWPDGTEEAAQQPTARAPLDEVDIAPPTAPATGMPLAPPPAAERVAPAASMPAPVTSDSSTDVQFAMPVIAFDSVPEPDADVPDDVASAVRRALQAIETAAVQPAALSRIDLAPLTLPDLEPSTADRVDEPEARTPEPAAPARTEPVSAQPLTGFAPPTAATSAEALYAQAAVAATVEAAPEPTATVDAPIDDDGGSRKGALKRLIGSLRKH